MKKIILSIIAVSFTFTVAHANETEDFESLLDNVSNIATKKSINVDYLPSVVTVVDAQTFINGGIVNLGEALGMLPGIQIQLSPMGYTMTTVRGLKNPNAYLSDKIKILVDGIAINNEITGSASFYLDLPMQLIEKIEVLRGPGSTIYGAGAFYATVNVITKLGNSVDENQVFLGMGSYNYRIAGANLNTSSGDWKIFTDGYYQKNDKEIYFENIGGNEDGYTDEAIKDLSLGFRATNGEFNFLARYKHNTSGNFYSFENQLDPIEDKDQGHTTDYFFTQLSHNTQLNDYTLETKATFSHRESDIEANIYSVDDIDNRFLKVGVIMNDGFFTQEQTTEQNYEFESTLNIPKIYANDISLGVGVHHSKVVNDDFYSSVENAITQNMDEIVIHPNYINQEFDYNNVDEFPFWANPTTSLLKENVSRTNVYASMQDLISVNEDTDIILGLRADNYSDFGTKFSKRAGVVYRTSDAVIFKLLYGSAFRVPTFTEAYANGHINYRAGNENILPEETNTYEAVAIYTPDFNNKFALNLFYSELSNVIDLEEEVFTYEGYTNYRDRYSRGVEFEYFFRKDTAHNLYLNATYIDAQYTVPEEDGTPAFDQSMPDISKIMFKAMYIYTPIKKLSFGTTWRYFAQTTPTELQWVVEEVNDGDYDSVASAVHIYDETVTYRFTPSSEARFSIKNIFNADIRMPSYYYYTADGGIKREGRNFFLSYIQRF